MVQKSAYRWNFPKIPLPRILLFFNLFAFYKENAMQTKKCFWKKLMQQNRNKKRERIKNNTNTCIIWLAVPPGAARDYFTIALWKSPVQIDLRTLRALGWGEPPANKILFSNPPRGATFVCWPPPNSQSIHPHLVGWTLRAPGLGEPPTNKILHGKPTPRSNFCLLAPTQFFTLQGFSDGVTKGGTPGGQHLGSAPGSVPSQGEMKSPRQILGWLVGWVRRQAAGHTHTHTHTHFLSSLYSRWVHLKR